MSKFNIIIVIFLGLAVYAYQNLKKNYITTHQNKSKESESSKKTVLKKEEITDKERVSEKKSKKIFYYVNVDHFRDGNEDNNEDVNLESTNAFHGGDLEGLTDSLDYISSLGVTDIVLSPINNQIKSPTSIMPNSNDGKKEVVVPHSGYYSEDIESIDSRFGSKDSLSTLIKEANSLGLKVHLTINLNSVHRDSLFPFSANGEKLFRKDAPTCSRSSEEYYNCLIKDNPDFLQEDPNVYKYLLNTLESKWLDLGFSGIFLLQGEGYNYKFLGKLYADLKKSYGEDFFMTILYSRLSAGNMDFYLNSNYVSDLISGNTSQLIGLFLNNKFKLKDFIPYYINIFKIPDEKLILPISRSFRSLKDILGDDAALTKSQLALMFTTGANIRLVDGDEVGVSRNFLNFKSFPWKKSEQDKDYKKIVKKFIGIYKKYDFSGDFKHIEVNTNGVFCFSKGTKNADSFDAKSLTCVNTSNERKTIKVSDIFAGWQKKPVDVVNLSSCELVLETLTCDIEARSQIILVKN